MVPKDSLKRMHSGQRLTAQAAPIYIQSFEDDGVVVDLQNNQQEHEEEQHENSHERGGSPTGSDLSVFRVEGSNEIA